MVRSFPDIGGMPPGPELFSASLSLRPGGRFHVLWRRFHSRMSAAVSILVSPQYSQGDVMMPEATIAAICLTKRVRRLDRSGVCGGVGADTGEDPGEGGVAGRLRVGGGFDDVQGVGHGEAVGDGRGDGWVSGLGEALQGDGGEGAHHEAWVWVGVQAGAGDGRVHDLLPDGEGLREGAERLRLCVSVGFH
nr:MAG TPA: hypothetical protein [Bacteriophage sp.]